MYIFSESNIIIAIFSLGAIGVPVVLLVLEGGPNTVRTMCELIKKKIPAVVVDGSGRAADVVAYAYSHTVKKWWEFVAIFEELLQWKTPRYNEPLYNEVPAIMNNILQPG